MSSIILSKNDCDFIKSYWREYDHLTEKNNSSLSIDDVNTINFSYKKVKGSYLDYTDINLLNFIIKKLKSINIISIKSGSVKINKYVKGDYFKPHRDFNLYGKGAIYKTLVIQLSDPSTYVGGDLYVKNIPQSKEQGSYSLFLSSDIHEIKPIIDGIRFSLVIFLYESDFSNQKHII